MAALNGLPVWFKEARGASCVVGNSVRPEGFVDKSLRAIAAYASEAACADKAAGGPGLLQSLDTRARIYGIFSLVAACAITSSAIVLVGLALIGGILTYASRVSPRALIKRVLPSFIFTSIIIAPVFFGFGAHGAHGASGGAERHWITAVSIATGAFIIARVTVMVSLAALIVLATRQADFFRGLGGLPVPSFFATALFMTFRYVFILIKIAEDAAMARKSRVIRPGHLGEPQSWFASRVALLLHKSLSVADEVNMAMISRGFSGARIKTFVAGSLGFGDYLWIGASTFVLFLSLGL